jgi:hypothetical protein
LGGLSVEITGTEELATDRQERFLRELGFPAEGITKHEATLRLTRSLRPIDFALSETFKNAHELEKAHLRALQTALARWERRRTFPRYGPESTWDQLNAAATAADPHRRLTKTERQAVTDLAFQVLPPAVFRSLLSNGVSKYKQALEATQVTASNA